VLELSRVRPRPTDVRRLADWGPNVIKIDALPEDAGSEQLGGARNGSDFQNLHRNKRAMTPNLKDVRGLRCQAARETHGNAKAIVLPGL
jgi:formyl-CoA transferase